MCVCASVCKIRFFKFIDVKSQEILEIQINQGGRKSSQPINQKTQKLFMVKTLLFIAPSLTCLFAVSDVQTGHICTSEIQRSPRNSDIRQMVDSIIYSVKPCIHKSQFSLFHIQSCLSNKKPESLAKTQTTLQS